jgi:hypothetical protein
LKQVENESPEHHREALGGGDGEAASQTDRLANLEAAVISIQQTLA